MRLALTAVIVCLLLLAWVMQPAQAQSTSPQTEPIDASAGQSEAAEKHAKRTACLKDAKSKKLVGAQKAAFVKDCMAADSAPDSQTSPTSAAR